MIDEIGYELEKKFKLKVGMGENVLTFNTPKYIGLYKHEDKMDKIEELVVKVVEFIREDERVFDVETHITYEQVRVSFIG